MNYNSDFSSDISEYVYQQIEEIKSVVSADALFLLEDVSEDDSTAVVVLKVKDGDSLFKVESSAESFIDAVFMAKEKIIEMILAKQESTVKSYSYEEKRIN